MNSKLSAALNIVLAVALLVVVAFVVFGAPATRVLPWAGVLAGLIAVLQALQLNTAGVVRFAVFAAGAATVALMLWAALQP